MSRGSKNEDTDSATAENILERMGNNSHNTLGLAACRQVVLKIVDDLTGRRGLEAAWEGIPLEWQQEIIEEWVSIVGVLLRGDNDMEPHRLPAIAQVILKDAVRGDSLTTVNPEYMAELEAAVEGHLADHPEDILDEDEDYFFIDRRRT